MEVRCPQCHSPIDMSDDTSLSDITCPSCGGSFSLLGEETLTHQAAEAKTIGHFELVDRIGIGSFGSVWRARDTELDRTVAVKIPRKGQLNAEESEQFLREARAAAQLRHPYIVGVHEVGREDDTVFIVSDFVEGLTLADWLTGERLSPRKAAELCAKIADALHHAHEAGVVHRDLKPGNIILDSTGEPHVTDFGLARREAGEVTMTVEGKVLGTPAYMSPEQAKGEAHQADRRSDVYSLGVILFELLTGEKPFCGSVRMLLQQVINKEAPRPRKLNRNIPRDLETICLKCLEKEARNRYGTARELAEDLRRYAAGYTIKARQPSLVRRMAKLVRRNPVIVTSAVLLLAMAFPMVLGIVKWRAERLRRMVLGEWVPEVQRLAEEERMVAACQLCQKAQSILPDDSTVMELWSQITVEGTVETDPPGAQVTIRDCRHKDDVWALAEETPLTGKRFPRGPLRWEFAKEGFVTVERLLSLEAGLLLAHLDGQEPGRENMVGVAFNRSVGQDRTAPEWDFWIDKFEVTNGQFLRFVQDGGYEESYWQELVADFPDTWQEQLAEFVDRSGRPGPKTWNNGRYPDGETELHPVRGVSWYEAVAYARYKGKFLPTVQQWEAAASFDQAHLITPLSNFDSQGPAPVKAYPAITSFGAYDMAGNVKEWCWDSTEGKKRCLRGGAWNDPGYTFGRFPDACDPTERPANVGFRCADRPDRPDQHDSENSPAKDYWTEQPAPDAVLEAYRRLYSFDANIPMNPSPPVVVSSGEFLHELVLIDDSRGQRLPIHFYLPRGAEPPHQTIVFVPGSDALKLDDFEQGDKRVEGRIRRPFVKQGRALCWPVYKGTYERRDDSIPWPLPPVRFRDVQVEMGKDLCRTVDYLKTRDDIDADNLVYVGWSLGAQLGPVLTVVKPTFRALVLISGGYVVRFRLEDEVDPFHYAPHVKIPVLMLNGEQDDFFPLATSQRPLFDHLGSEDKQHRVQERAGHVMSIEWAVSEAGSWLDERLGPVRQKSSD